MSHAVHPPTMEHVYAQWQEREELLSRTPLEILQDDNGQNLDERKDDVGPPISGEHSSWNHFKTSNAFRHKLKGNVLNTGLEVIKIFVCVWASPSVSKCVNITFEKEGCRF